MNRIHFLRGTDLVFHSTLAHTMFRDRKTQFEDRLKWPVYVDEQGFEVDEYDTANPIYVVLQGNNGAHLGSLRLLPTTGPTMINEHFLDVLQGKPLSRPGTWECTRFCVSEHASKDISAKLLAATGFLMKQREIAELVAVFDAVMLRQYRLTGASPSIIGSCNSSGQEIMAGTWDFSPAKLRHLLKRANLDPIELELWLANSKLCIDRKKHKKLVDGTA